MRNGNLKPAPTGHDSPFEQIRRTNTAGAEFWSSREFAGVLGYSDYRNFEQVIQKARLACFNSGQKVEDHFVDVTELIEIGKGGQPVPRHTDRREATPRPSIREGTGESNALRGRRKGSTDDTRAGGDDAGEVADRGEHQASRGPETEGAQTKGVAGEMRDSDSLRHRDETQRPRPTRPPS